MYLSFSYLLLITYVHVHSDFSFSEHLLDLFHVITSLDCDNSSDLLRLQRFIHHRAYRKLGYRVLDFSERWGTSPIGILLENIDPTLKSTTFQLTLDRSFRSYLERFGLRPDAEQDSRSTFTINPTAATAAAKQSLTEPMILADVYSTYMYTDRRILILTSLSTAHCPPFLIPGIVQI